MRFCLKHKNEEERKHALEPSSVTDKDGSMRKRKDKVKSECQGGEEEVLSCPTESAMCVQK